MPDRGFIASGMTTGRDVAASRRPE